MLSVHRHKWLSFIFSAIGKYEKQKGQGNPIYVRGVIKICYCGVAKLFPDNKRLRPVEVEL